MWELISNELVVSNEKLSVAECLPFAVTELGIVSFDMPSVDHPTRARLVLRLISGENLIAVTEQEFYVFPDISSKANGKRVYSPEYYLVLEHLGWGIVDDLSRADVAVVTTLDDACREFLLHGGKVLFLAEKDDALQTYLPHLGIEPRNGTPWQGD